MSSKPAFDVYLSPPGLSGEELNLMEEAVKSGWIAPFGPQLEAFEKAIARQCEVPHVLAVQSGTAALHLSLVLAGVGSGDEVLCPTFTFAAIPSMITLAGASPVFVDCEPGNWNMSPALAERYLTTSFQRKKRPKAMILVHNYGAMAPMEAFRELCKRHELVLIEDAAEALGSTLGGVPAGSAGHYGILSFNGNKLITAIGGGALLLHSAEEYEKAKSLALQAKDTAVVPYLHHTAGFNYRMNNVQAAFGLAQLADLARRIKRKREIHAFYEETLREYAHFQTMENNDVPWLTAVELPCPWQDVYNQLKFRRIESRPAWRPLHTQPAFAHHAVVEGSCAEGLFQSGLCLPSGIGLHLPAQEMVVSTIIEVVKGRQVK